MDWYSDLSEQRKVRPEVAACRSCGQPFDMDLASDAFCRHGTGVGRRLITMDIVDETQGAVDGKIDAKIDLPCSKASSIGTTMVRRAGSPENR